MQYQLEFSLTDQDYYEFSTYHQLHDPRMKKRNAWMRLYPPVLLLLVTVYAFLRLYKLTPYDRSGLYTLAISFLVFSAIWFFSYKHLLSLSVKARIRSMKESGKMPYSPSATMCFFADHFSETTPDSKTEMPYSAVMRVSVSEQNAIYLYRDVLQAYIIPYRAFSSHGAYEAFLTFLNGKVDGKQAVKDSRYGA